MCYHCKTPIQGQTWYVTKIHEDTLLLCHPCTDEIVYHGLLPQYLDEQFSLLRQTNINVINICNRQKAEIASLKVVCDMLKRHSETVDENNKKSQL
jgi:hypothetical protein